MTIGTATADTFTVNNSTGPVADFTSIQAAVDAALDGDFILVYPGIYDENVDVNKQLNITSTGGYAVTHVTAASFDDDVFEVTVDGVTINGFYVIGGGSARAIALHEIENCIVINNKMSNNPYGIFLDRSSNNTLISNTVSGNVNGIYLYRSSNNNTLISNKASGNSRGIYLGRSSSNNTLISNTASGNSRGIHLYDSTNNTLINNTALGNTQGIALDDSSSNNTLINNTASGNDNGIYLDRSSSDNTLTSNKVSNNTYYGIFLRGSNNNLTSNTISNNTFGGINMVYSSNNMLVSNKVSGNIGSGIFLEYSYNNTLTSNTASNNNGIGIDLYGSSDNTLTSNTVSNNTYYGILLRSSSNNLIYNNYFYNFVNTDFSWSNTGNVWNTTKTAGKNIVGGPYLGGNYWAKPNGTGFSQINIDMDCDGFCDSPLNKYELDVNDIDYLPLCLVTYNPYDENEDYVIDIGEVSEAIDDYRTQGPTSIAMVSELIDMYRSGEPYC